MAAGDAAASAYLHPLADTTQVKHILRAPAHAIRVLELTDDLVKDDGSFQDSDTDTFLQRFATFATPRLINVLRRYPRLDPVSSQIDEGPGRTGARTNRINLLMYELEGRLGVRPPLTPEQS